MARLSDIAELIPTLCGHDASAVACQCGGGGAPAGASETSQQYEARMLAMNDDEILAIMQESASVERQAALLRQIATGIAAARSARAFGHGGLAARRGHRSAVSLVQDLLGVSQAEAARQVRVSEDLVETSGTTGLPDSVAGSGQRTPAIKNGEAEGGGASGGSDSDATVCPPRPWYEPLRVALRAQTLSNEQADTIRKGLGEPPVMPRDANGVPLAATDHAPTVEEADAFDAGARDAWYLAAEQLVAEAQVRKIKDLLAHARYIRDKLDPEGAKRRFEQRYEARSFQMVQTDTGAMRILWTLDDQTALMITAAHDAALRPRRGGPRFVDSADAAQAQALAADSRTNAQLASDLMSDIVRAGILADARSVFGTRQAGVRLVQVIDAHGQHADTAHSEDRLVALPGAAVDQHLCNTESTRVSIDANGNPLNLGRTKRLFTAAQKVALAVRDGGCRWPGCDRPASYTEAHHIDPWEEGGRTDTDRGILLCQYHHLNCHDNGWRITRQGRGAFMLTHPDHPPRALPTRTPLEYAFKNIALPEPRFRATHRRLDPEPASHSAHTSLPSERLPSERLPSEPQDRLAV